MRTSLRSECSVDRFFLGMVTPNCTFWAESGLAVALRGLSEGFNKFGIGFWMALLDGRADGHHDQGERG